MRAITVFLLLAFASSSSVAGYINATGGLGTQGPLGSAGLLALTMMGPGVATLVTSLLFDKGRRLAALGLRGFRVAQVLRWTLLAWLVPVTICALSVIVTIALSGQPAGDPAAFLVAQVEASGQTVPMEPATLLTLQFAIGLPVGIAFNTVFLMISEEIGWRGWLQPRLAGLGFWPMCLVIGAIWGIWHGPIILMGYNYPGLGWTGVAVMTVFTILWTPYHALARERGGLIAAAGMHGSLNAVAGASLIFLSAPQWPWNGPLGLGGMLVLAAGLPLLAWFRHSTATKSA